MNPVGWFEIYVSDIARARTFYEGVFNFKMNAMMESDDLDMWAFPNERGETGIGGTLVRMKGLTPSGISSVVYFISPSEDCAVEEKRVAECGGRIHKSKFSIGEYGFIVLAYDTEGNMFGIHSMA